MSVNLNGSYANLGKETLIALDKTAKSDSKLEAAEVDEIEKAARADNDFSDGEKALIAKLREATRDNQSVNNFQIAGFDPAAPELAFGGFQLDISGNTGSTKIEYIEKLRGAVSANNKTSDPAIRGLVADQARLELAAKLSPDRLIEGAGVLIAGSYTDADRDAVVKIFDALPTAKQSELLQKVATSGDHATLRALSQKGTALEALLKADPKALDSAIDALQTGTYSAEDAAGVTRFVESLDPARQKSFVEGLIKRNGPSDDDTLAAIGASEKILKNLDTATKLKTLHVLQAGKPEPQSKTGSRLILEHLGLLTLTGDQAKQIAKGLEGLTDAQKDQIAARLDKLSSVQKADLVKVMTQLDASQLKPMFGALAQTANDSEAASLIKLMSSPATKPAQLKAFLGDLAKLKAPEQTGALKLIDLLMQNPPPATLRADVQSTVTGLGAGATAVGKTLNQVGLFLPSANPLAPGAEDASSRLKTVYMGQYYSNNEPQGDYVRDMLKLSKDENFKVVLQGSLTEFPDPPPVADLQAKLTAMNAAGKFTRPTLDATIKLLEDRGAIPPSVTDPADKDMMAAVFMAKQELQAPTVNARVTALNGAGAFTRAALDPVIKQLEDLKVIAPAATAAEKDQAAKEYLAKVDLFKDKLIDEMVSQEGMDPTDAKNLVRDANRLEIKLSPLEGYDWAEDNKWVTADGQSFKTLPKVDDAVFTKASQFVTADLGQAAGKGEGHHTAGLPRNDPQSHGFPTGYVNEGSMQAAVSSRDQHLSAAQLATALGKPVNQTSIYNEGGNLLTGTLPNGDPYAVVGRDGLIQSVFHLEAQVPPPAEFDPAKVTAKAAGMSFTPAQIDETVKRLKAAGESGADPTRAKEFLAKIEIAKEIFAKDLFGDPAKVGNIVFVSQPEFHIDMHLRPLGPGQIMVNDYNQSIAMLEKALKRPGLPSWEKDELKSMLEHTKKMKAVMQPVMEQIQKQLGSSALGLQVVPAPGVMESQWQDRQLDASHLDLFQKTIEQTFGGPLLDAADLAPINAKLGTKLTRDQLGKDLYTALETKIKAASLSADDEKRALDAARALVQRQLDTMYTRHINFMNAVPGTSLGTNEQYYITNDTSLPSLKAEFTDFLAKQGVEKVHWIGGDGAGAPPKRSNSERSLLAQGGLDCRENH